MTTMTSDEGAFREQFIRGYIFDLPVYNTEGYELSRDRFSISEMTRLEEILGNVQRFINDYGICSESEHYRDHIEKQLGEIYMKWKKGEL